MKNLKLLPANGEPPLLLLFIIGLLLVIGNLVGCNMQNLEEIDYTPLEQSDWQTSTPAQAGLDTKAVAQVYAKAAKLKTIYSLLIIKNDKLVAEQYYHGNSVESLDKRASVTKSLTSALMGLALSQGYINSVDEKMLDYFPELQDKISDPRKYEITIQQMLQMRAGYPWEETDARLWDAIWSGKYIDLLEHFPLTAAPGTAFQYSNLTAHWAGIIVARATNTDLQTLAQHNLYDKLQITPGPWIKDLDGYNIGSGDIQLTARDMAKLGLLYLNDGVYQGEQILPASWVQQSLQTYTENAWTIRIGRNMRDMGYGYFWWSARAGSHPINFAWGHGGNLIVLVHDLDMVIVVTADPFYGKEVHWHSWKYEKANINLVCDFIASL